MKIIIDYRTIKKIGRRLKVEVLDADKSAGSLRQALKSKAVAQFLESKYNGGFSLEDVEKLQLERYCKELIENGKAIETYNIYCKYNK